MIKTDNRHYNNTKGNRELKLTMDAWIKWNGKQVDFNCEWNGKNVCGKVINVLYKGTKKNGILYLSLDNGVKDFPVRIYKERKLKVENI